MHTNHLRWELQQTGVLRDPCTQTTRGESYSKLVSCVTYAHKPPEVRATANWCPVWPMHTNHPRWELQQTSVLCGPCTQTTRGESYSKLVSHVTHAHKPPEVRATANWCPAWPMHTNHPRWELQQTGVLRDPCTQTTRGESYSKLVSCMTHAHKPPEVRAIANWCPAWPMHTNHPRWELQQTGVLRDLCTQTTRGESYSKLVSCVTHSYKPPEVRATVNWCPAWPMHTNHPRWELQQTGVLRDLCTQTTLGESYSKLVSCVTYAHKPPEVRPGGVASEAYT